MRSRRERGRAGGGKGSQRWERRNHLTKEFVGATKRLRPSHGERGQTNVEVAFRSELLELPSLERTGRRPTSHRPIDRARKGSGPGRIDVRCPHTNELINNQIPVDRTKSLG